MSGFTEVMRAAIMEPSKTLIYIYICMYSLQRLENVACMCFVVLYKVKIHCEYNKAQKALHKPYRPL